MGDWQDYPSYASSIDDFVGEPSNKETAKAIIDRLRTALIVNNVVKSEDLNIRAIPVERSKLLLIVGVQAASTPNNSIIQGELAVVSIVYDYLERGVFFLEPENDDAGG